MAYQNASNQKDAYCVFFYLETPFKFIEKNRKLLYNSLSV